VNTNRGKKVSGIGYLKKIDKRQLFRLFVDGRFQKKYTGWLGYESGERGSVQAILNGFSYMLDNLDMPQGLQCTYLRQLHKVTMLNVETSNLKSSPGDIRYLNAGMPFFSKTTTIEHLHEVFEMRKGDGTEIFNNRRFRKKVEELDVSTVFQAIQDEKKLNYRHWYPNLDVKVQEAIEGKLSLHEFYDAKHSVQMLIIAKMEAIVDRYNQAISIAKTDDEKLLAIAPVSRELELLHPFPDGNCRTFSCITLTQLLITNGFPPALLENPNLDNEVSLLQWIEEIKKGIQRTLDLIKDPSLALFGFSINDISHTDNEYFLSMASNVILKLDNYHEIYLTARKLSEYTQGQWFNLKINHLGFTGVGTYNTYSKGNIYFALSLKDWINEKKDIKKQFHSLIKKGIKAFVIDDSRYLPYLSLYPVLLVNDCFKAFKQAAVQNKKDSQCFTVLLTGTEGKTGAKIQLNHLLNYQTNAHAVLNSANIEIPVLRSLINIGKDDKVEINEVSVGSDEAYRVERSMMVSPDLCLFTNIGPNHMDMHKTIGNLLDAKSSVVEGLSDDGLCIIDASNQYFAGLVGAIKRRRANVHIETYGKDRENTAYLISASFDSDKLGWHVVASIDNEVIEYFLPLFQQHAPLASVGILLTIQKMGYDIQQAASDYASLVPYQTMGKVLKLHKPDGDIFYYDQSRRGGINGMRSAFNDLNNFKIKGNFVAVVGGISVKKDSEWTKQAHTELAQFINKSPISRLYTTGNFMTYVRDNLTDPTIFVNHIDDLDELADHLITDLQPGDGLFIIGSAYLYLGRLSDKLVNYQYENSYDSRIKQMGLSELALLQYNILLTFYDIEKGKPVAKSCKTHAVSEGEYQQWKKKYVSFSYFRGKMLMDFFKQLDKLFCKDFQFNNINQSIKDSNYSNSIITQDYSQRWFNNLDKLKSIKNKQLIGSFFDFGSEKYLLRVEVATLNLHIGFIKFIKHDSKYKILAIEQIDKDNLLSNYPKLNELEFPLEIRKWGFGCISLDCHSLINLTNANIFSSLFSVENSPLFKEKFIPLLRAIK
jgi:UDP-N-acetylmuramyl pentapeptide synthase